MHCAAIQACLRPTPRVPDAHYTSPQRNTHISERRTVHYPWHPWRDRSVFIDERVEKNGRVMFRCHVEETQQWRSQIGCSVQPAATCVWLTRPGSYAKRWGK